MSMPPPPAVRAAGPGDNAEWMRLRAALWPSMTAAEHAAEVEQLLDESRSASGREPRLMAEVFVSDAPGGGLDGFLELSVRPYAEGCAGAAAYIEGWWVDPPSRGRGVGRALVEAAEAWARERGLREIASDTELDNTASQRAHAALGYAEVERAVHFRKAL